MPNKQSGRAEEERSLRAALAGNSARARETDGPDVSVTRARALEKRR